jgi:hypothetical protein
MEETFFDLDGNPVAYIDYNDENTIYMWDGTPSAYLDEENRIYGFNGKHLGWFEDGILWDLKGDRTGYNKQTIPVFAKFEPFKAFKKFKPFKSFKEFSKFKPFKKTSRSNTSLPQFFAGGQK